MYAASNGNKEIAELLIKQADIDINIQNILNQKHSYYSNLTFFMKLNN